MGAAAAPALASSESSGSSEGGPTVDSWSAKDQRIVVSQPAAGFLYDLVLRAKIEGDPDDVYTVLVDPNSHEIFRGIKATLSRTVLENDGRGRRKLRIGHRALTKFLWINVTFDTELFVWEDDVARTIRFSNARSDGFMSKFEGQWDVQPFTQATLDSIYQHKTSGVQQQDKGHNWLGSILHHASHASHSSSAQGCGSLVTLTQALSPRAKPPGPVAHLVRGLCGRVLHNMMEDLRAEVARRSTQQQTQQTQEAEAADGSKGGQSLFGSLSSSSSRSSRQAASTPSLPVASLTLASSSSSGSAGSWSSSWSGSSSSSWSGSSSSSSKGGNPLCAAGDALTELLAAAVPLHVTIQL